MGYVKNIIVAGCDNLRITLFRDLGYSGILTINRKEKYGNDILQKEKN